MKGQEERGRKCGRSISSPTKFLRLCFGCHVPCVKSLTRPSRTTNQMSIFPTAAISNKITNNKLKKCQFSKAKMDFVIITTIFLLVFIQMTHSVDGRVYKFIDEFASRRSHVKIRVSKGEITPGHYPLSMQLNFEAFGRNFSLKLWKNPGMFSSNYTRSDIDNQKVKPFDDIGKLCQYNGAVIGSNRSHVAVTLCNGVRGIFHDGQNIFAVDSQNDDIDRLHVIEKLSENSNLENMAQVSQPMRYIETILVLDPMLKQRFLGKAVDTSELIVNIANLMMNYLNIQIVLKETTISNETGFSGVDLQRLIRYRKSRQMEGNRHDLTAMLFSLDGQSASLESRTYLKGMCSMEYSIAMVDVKNTVELTAQSFAHALGHSIGLGHDTAACRCEGGPCVMSTLDNQFQMQWSGCSVINLEKLYLESQDMCLRDKPRSLDDVSQMAVCGNGKIESEEDCDCGNDCDRQICCDPQTCTFIPGAVCSTGECCNLDTCRYKELAVLCRPAREECDLEEYCDGRGSKCPLDAYIQDGNSCSNGKSYCYQGGCNTYDDQCKQLWGENSIVAADMCFHEQNVLGDNTGYCKHDMISDRYAPCSELDAKCGQIFCTGMQGENVIGSHLARTSLIFLQDDKGRINKCLSISIDFGLSIRDLGMVQDGQKCGENRICMDSQCVHIDSLNLSNKSCSGHGIVNNYGECHCKLGYAPPDCNAVGPGGSMMSGPASIFLSMTKANTPETWVKTAGSTTVTTVIETEDGSATTRTSGVMTTAMTDQTTATYPNTRYAETPTRSSSTEAAENGEEEESEEAKKAFTEIDDILDSFLDSLDDLRFI